MNFGVSLLLVRSGKFPAAGVTGERFLSWERGLLVTDCQPGCVTCVGPDVGGEVVRPAEGPHADPALERFLT